MRNIFGLLFILLLISSCNSSAEEQPTESSKKLKITCTTSMLGDAVKQMFGDAVDVDVLMGPGVDPHLYKATQGDLGRLTDADVIVYNGLHLEGKMGTILENLALRKPVIAAAELLPENRLLYLSVEDDIHDPHVWFDVRLWAFLCHELRDSLISIDSTGLSSTLEQSDAYLFELRQLDDWTRMELSKIPQEQRVLITAHDAYEYFGRAYGVEVKGLQGISTVAEYGLRDVSELVQFISSRKIPAIFLESSVPKRSMEAVLEGCQRNGFEVKLGATLFSDAMGDENTPEGTYIGMVKHNVNSIKSALMP